jgi:hypothetical protein
VSVVAAAGIGFLLAVLWFDLMFDVQVRGHHEAVLPAEVRDSVAAYYRRVTTNAYPMNRLVATAMLVTIAALIGEVADGDVHSGVAWSSLALTAAAVGLAGARTVRRAVQLGSQAGTAEQQTVLARSVFRDHIACVAAISLALALQIGWAR